MGLFGRQTGPCRFLRRMVCSLQVLSPILDEIAEEYYGSIDVYKVNTETEEELAAVFHVRSIPTLLFIPKEGAPQIVNGALPKHQIMELVERVLLAR